jgi:hypothetical protein
MADREFGAVPWMPPGDRMGDHAGRPICASRPGWRVAFRDVSAGRAIPSPAMAAAVTIYPAVCPRCGAEVVETLLMDPGVPIYACGSLPYRIRCLIPLQVDRNVSTLELGELVDLGDYLGRWSRAVDP